MPARAESSVLPWRAHARLVRLSLREWRMLVLLGALVGLNAGVAALQPWPLKILVDDGLGGGRGPALLRPLAAALAGETGRVAWIAVAAVASAALFALGSATNVASSWVAGKAGQRNAYELSALLLERLQRWSPAASRRMPVGDALTRVTGDVGCAWAVTDALLLAPWQAGIRIAGVGALAFGLDPGLAAVVFAVAPLLALWAVVFGPRLKRGARTSREARARLTSFVQQSLSSVALVQTFGAEEREGHRFRVLAADAASAAQRQEFVRGSFELVNGLVTTTGSALVLFVGGTRVLSGAISVGTLLVLMAYMGTLHTAFRMLFGLYGKLRAFEANAERVVEVLDAEEGVRERPGARSLPSPGARGSAVALERVSFGYEPGRLVLRGVSLEVRPGETLALVGPTGAGKSTLVSLIPRLFDAQEGRVVLDGCDVREATLASVRGRVSVVPQEPLLLPFSVAENIAYGRPEAGRRKVEAAARAANAAEFIEKLPQGYGTPLGERGATLSWGERQRLAIARALLRDAPILILDEPTSALDAQTEAEVLEALERLRVGRTTFVIAHRLSTVRGADRVVVLDAGELVESGTHEALLRAGGLYARLHERHWGSGLAAAGGGA